MGNILGNNLKMIVSGESHGEYLCVTLDNFPSGVKIDYDYINEALMERRPIGLGETMRIEPDEYKIITGVFNDITTGQAITIIIPNVNKKSNDYEDTKYLLRPSHADFTGYMKYHGLNDYRGGGHFSGRLTVAIVIAGCICDMALRKFNIVVSSHIKNIGEIKDRSFNTVDLEKIKTDIEILNNKHFKVLDNIEDKMLNLMAEVAMSNDSIAGSIETIIVGQPIGLGDPMFNSIESEISKAVFSIPAVKGIEFGLGFEFENKKGSEVNDEFTLSGEDIVTKTNNNAGVNGGITNGMPIYFRTVIKPTPSISRAQGTVNIKTKQKEVLEINGRHDPAIVRRANVVVRSITSFVMTDFIIEKYGNDFYTMEKL